MWHFLVPGIFICSFGCSRDFKVPINLFFIASRFFWNELINFLCRIKANIFCHYCFPCRCFKAKATLGINQIFFVTFYTIVMDKCLTVFHGKLTNWLGKHLSILIAFCNCFLKSVDVIFRIKLDEVFYNCLSKRLVLFMIIWQMIYVAVVLWMMSCSVVEWKLLIIEICIWSLDLGDPEIFLEKSMWKIVPWFQCKITFQWYLSFSIWNLCLRYFWDSFKSPSSTVLTSFRRFLSQFALLM